MLTSVEIIDKLGLTYVPVFYKGEFISWEECMKYVGQTQLGGEYGEGIVGIIYVGYSATKAFEKTEGKFELERRRRMVTEELEIDEEELDELIAEAKKEMERIVSLKEDTDSVYKEFPEWDIYQESRGGDE